METEIGSSESRRSSGPFLGAQPPSGARRGDGLVGHRYEVINEIGHGGMGLVYRALDRLTGRVVILKRLREQLESPPEGRSSLLEQRRRLTAEFEVLTSLRHPNIISVLEFGFDSDGKPFFTMNLEENAQNLVEAGRAQPLAVQADLLVQCLRALAYLHDYGVIHRDLKPENILVVRGQVKVLDFGLSIRRDASLEADESWAGTVAFMAPEIIDGQAATVASDLYSFGMLSLELLTGRSPFPVGNVHKLLSQIRSCHLPRPEDRLDPRLRPVLERLLDRNPARRFPSAAEVIEAFAKALGQPMAVDTVATRESFLQAAPFVGRKTELSMLEEAVDQAREGRGSSWLLAGESGVGKSRLLEELRTRALVGGSIVLRAQSVADGGSPFHVWREGIRALILTAQPSDPVAAALRSIVPDVSILLGREIADAPKVDPEAAQTRLQLAVENLFRLLDAPVLLILEDLQWVGSESTALFSWLSRSAPGLRLVLIGSFREDEAPELPAEIPTAKRIALQRLNAEEIAELGESMIGQAARVPAVVDLLRRETEGIPFFLVEVVRELAERSGGRERIANTRLPESVVSGGMQRSLRRRLDRVPGDALGVLATAAVVGREIDPRLVCAVHGNVEFDDWARICARAALIELRQQTWRFAHDKVRDQLLVDLAPRERAERHRRVAEALELEYPERRDFLAALAHHWREAGVRQKEAHYAEQAGLLALESGGCRESIALLGRALEILASSPEGEPGAAAAHDGGRRTTWRPRLDLNAGVDPASPSFRLGLIEGALSEAHYRLGDLTGCREHGERALGHFGQRVPDGDSGWRRAALGQWGLRAAQSLLHFQSPKSERTQTVARAIARAQGKLTDAAFYSLHATRVLWSSARLVNQCDPVGPSSELARGYVILGLLANLTSASWLADRWCRRALAIAEEAGTEQDVAWVLSRTCVLHQGNCRWSEFEKLMPRATAIAEQVGDIKLWEECRAQAGAVHLYRGEYESSLAVFDDSFRLSRRSGNRQVDCWALFGRADALVRLGEHDQAVPIYESALHDLDEEGLKTEAIWGVGSLAVARLHAGDEEGAYETALRALAHIDKSPPIAYWTEPGFAGTAEVLLRLLERGWKPPSGAAGSLAEQAGRARASLLNFAKRFPLAQPSAALWDGLSAWIDARRGRAIRSWHRAIKDALRLGTPYELGLAHLELGRHLSGAAGQPHLAKAAEVFERLGCARELAQTKRADEHG